MEGNDTSGNHFLFGFFLTMIPRWKSSGLNCTAYWHKNINFTLCFTRVLQTADLNWNVWLRR